MKSRVLTPAIVLAAVVLGVGSIMLMPGLDTRAAIFAIVSTMYVIAVGSTAFSMGAHGLSISRGGGAATQIQAARQRELATRFLLAITLGTLLLVLVGRATIWADQTGGINLPDAASHS